MKHHAITFLILISLACTTSCVSYRKYEDTLAERNEAVKKSKEQENQLEATEKQLQQLSSEYEDQNRRLARSEEDLKGTMERYQQLDRTNRDLLDRYDRMLSQNEKLVSSTSDEKQQLQIELATQQSELSRKEQALRKLEQEIEKREADVSSLRTDLQAREARVQELEKAIGEKDAKLSALQSKINQALLGFSATDLSVREENGKVYVSLSQNLLYKSGSKAINSAGKEAISKLAQVLKANQDIEITVEGHTDSDGEADFNWDLSVGRATTVVKELTSNGIAPERITAAGRGEHYPVSSNNNASGKALNRRTEIILSPNLDALYNIINN